MKKIAQDLVSLGEFRPNWTSNGGPFNLFLNEHVAEWTRAAAEALAELHMSIREPAYGNCTVRDPSWHSQAIDDYASTISNWHCDDNVNLGAGNKCQDAWMVVWASCNPTEIRMHGGLSIFQGHPYEMVAFRNGAYQHRTPVLSTWDLANRWFARAYTAFPTSQLDSQVNRYMETYLFHADEIRVETQWAGQYVKNYLVNPGFAVTRRRNP